MERCKTNFPNKLVYNGYDEMFLAGLSMGADGGIGSTYNFMTDKFVKIKKLFEENKLKEAQELQQEVNGIIAVLCSIGVMQAENGVVFNGYNNGVIDYVTPNGNQMRFAIEGEYLSQGEVFIKLSMVAPETLAINLRIPAWSNHPQVYVNGTMHVVQKGYVKLEREWKNGDEITLSLYPELRKIDLNGKSAFVYGNIVLARDEQKEQASIAEPFTTVVKYRRPIAKMEEPEEGETVRFLLETDGGEVLLTDYASCGKKWSEPNARISVWMQQK
jgi:hypothetical protein